MKHQTNPAIAVTRLRDAAKYGKLKLDANAFFYFGSFYSRRFKL